MSTTLEFNKITNEERSISGVSALSDRPNEPGLYGVGGLNAKDLKNWFDKFANLLADKFNAFCDVFKGEGGADVAQYIKLQNFGSYDTMRDVLEGIKDGSFANVMMAKASAAAENTSSLQSILNSMAESISNSIPTDYIVDNLTTDDATKVLSAKQGKALKAIADLKIAISSIADNLTTDDATNVLSAKQGKALDNKKVEKYTTTDGKKYAYTVDNGVQGKTEITETPTAAKLPVYGANGVLKTEDPVTDTDASKEVPNVKFVRGKINGLSVDLVMDSSSYTIKAILKSGTATIAESSEIDLPLETLIANLTYSNGNIVVTLKNGSTTEIPITDVIEDSDFYYLLVSKNKYTVFSRPVENDILDVQLSDLSRTPVIGEYFVLFLTQHNVDPSTMVETEVDSFVAHCEVKEITNSDYVKAEIKSIYSTKGATGATGAKLVSQTLTGYDTNGNAEYQQTFDDGTTATFITPKGDTATVYAEYSTYSGNSFFKIPYDNIQAGKYYTIVCSIDITEWDTLKQDPNAKIYLWKYKSNNDFQVILTVGGVFKLIDFSSTNLDKWEHYQLPSAINQEKYYFAVSGYLYEKDGNLYLLLDDMYTKQVADLKTYTDGQIANIETHTKDMKLNISNLYVALNKYVLGFDAESFLSIKNAVLPSSITVDNEVYPIADGTRALLSSVKGNTKQFNQLINVGTGEQTNSGITATKGSDGSVTLNGTATADVNFYFIILGGGLKLNHKYLITGAPNTASDTTYWWGCDKSIPFNGTFYDTGNGNIKTVTTADNNESYWYITVKIGVTVDNVKFIPQAHDLTAMGLDSITTVEEFNALYSKAYYPNNAGTLYDSVVSGVSLTGKNLLGLSETSTYGTVTASFSDGVVTVTGNGQSPTANTNWKSGFNFVLKAGTYYLSYSKVSGEGSAQFSLVDYDTDRIIRFLAGSVTLERDTHVYIGIYTTEGSKNCLYNVQLEVGSTATAYEPYRLSTIAIPSTQTLGGVGTSQDEIQVTKNENDDYYTIKKIKRVESVDLGTLAWRSSSSISNAFFADMVDGLYRAGATNAICSKYTVGTEDKNIRFQNSTENAQLLRLFVVDSSYSDAVSFKAAMSGVIVTYELITPVETTITETATLSDVSAIRENGGMISVVGNTNEDYVQPDVSEIVLYQKALLNS